ncbi:MAG TPA: flagellar protein FlaG [Bacillota bacterium]|nr:flagellar protein FlaG [Bacillota bacterium]
MKVEGVNTVPKTMRVPDVGVLESGRQETAEGSKAAAADSMLRDTRQSSMSISERQLIEAIENANKALRGADKRFEFSIHEGTKEIMVKVINEETGEIIREIPPEKILDMVAKMWELAGILVDRKI